jgi:spermidine synthase
LKVPLYKRLLSYLAPIWVKRGNSRENPDLELLLYRGRWQLATTDAIYSDADKYTPILTAYKSLEHKLPSLKNVLVLGSGLGSAVQIMGQRGYTPDFTLIENDEQVLEWAKDLMPAYNGNVKMIKADAMFYLDVDREKYDLLIVDVFKGREVPEFITTKPFMEKCRSHISESGNFVLNYIIEEDQRWLKFKLILNEVFPGHTAIKNGINRIIVATA